MERERKKTYTLIAWDKPGMAYNHGIFDVAVNEVNNHVYVSGFRTPKLLVVDGKKNEYVDVIDLPGFTPESEIDEEGDEEFDDSKEFNAALNEI